MSYTIEVSVNKLSYDTIVEYFNNHKNDFEKSIGRINGVGDGFEIEFIENDENILSKKYKKICKLILEDGMLITKFPHYDLTDYQLDLLYDSIKHDIGEKNVRKINKVYYSNFYFVKKKS